MGFLSLSFSGFTSSQEVYGKEGSTYLDRGLDSLVCFLMDKIGRIGVFGPRFGSCGLLLMDIIGKIGGKVGMKQL